MGLNQTPALIIMFIYISNISSQANKPNGHEKQVQNELY